MRTSSVLLLSVFLASSTLACGGDKPADDKKTDDKKADDKKADDVKADDAPAADGGAAADGGGAAGEVALPKVGLKGDGPAGTTVMAMGDDDMVQGPGFVVTVGKGDDKPKTGDEAIADADMYTPKDPKVETLPDGYVLTFTNEGGAGTNYWVNARREIDGAAYWCSTTATTQEQSDNAVAFCKSLRK